MYVRFFVAYTKSNALENAQISDAKFLLLIMSTLHVDVVRA